MTTKKLIYIIGAYTAMYICIGLLLAYPISSAQAMIKLSGHFISKQKCPAYVSLQKKSNPGQVMTEVNFTYTLLGKNKDSATHYLIEVDAQPHRRWVAIRCGKSVISSDINTSTDKPSVGPKSSPKANRYILAISWQPGFCETRPGKPECRNQTRSRYDANHFTLHGLWPQPSKNVYCGVDPEELAKDTKDKWSSLPLLDLDAETRRELNKVMPGTRSFLHRHEWIKHGTCYNGKSPEVYYRDSLNLMAQINHGNSAFRQLFAENIGREITANQITTAFEETFGSTTSNKIKIACKRDGNRLLITEITIGLQGELDEISMQEALLAAPDANNIGCLKGIVDPVGFQ